MRLLAIGKVNNVGGGCMSKKSISRFLIILFLAVGFIVGPANTLVAHHCVAEKLMVAKACACPKLASEEISGRFEAVSMRARTLQVRVGPRMWVIHFDDETKLVGADTYRDILPRAFVDVTFTTKDGAHLASKVVVKLPLVVAPEKLIGTEEVAKLVAIGPEKGRFMIVDMRPARRYHERHIPGAVNILPGKLKDYADILPNEKDILLIFYCGGVH